MCELAYVRFHQLHLTCEVALFTKETRVGIYGLAIITMSKAYNKQKVTGHSVIRRMVVYSCHTRLVTIGLYSVSRPLLNAIRAHTHAKELSSTVTSLLSINFCSH